MMQLNFCKTDPSVWTVELFSEIVKCTQGKWRECVEVCIAHSITWVCVSAWTWMRRSLAFSTNPQHPETPYKTTRNRQEKRAVPASHTLVISPSLPPSRVLGRDNHPCSPPSLFITASLSVHGLYTNTADEQTQKSMEVHRHTHQHLFCTSRESLQTVLIKNEWCLV